jgi:hypothetical protein
MVPGRAENSASRQSDDIIIDEGANESTNPWAAHPECIESEEEGSEAELSELPVHYN